MPGNQRLDFKVIFLGLGVALSATHALAKNSGVPFLNLGIGARAQAMGGAHRALSQGADSVFWNPAALPDLKAPEAHLFHNRFISDYQQAFAAYAHPAADGSFGWGASFNYFHKGTFSGRDELRRPTGDFSAADSALTLAGGRRMGGSFSVGMGLKAVHSRIESHTALGAAADVTASWRTDRRWRFAAGLFNFGPDMKYRDTTFYLPTRLGAGVGFVPHPSLTLASDLLYDVHARDAEVSLGGEWVFSGLAALRVGFLPKNMNDNKSDAPASALENWTGLRMGLGLNLFSRAGLDYAFTPMGELGGTHQTSLTYRF